MSEYLLRLAVLLPLVCGLIVGGLWLARRLQERGPKFARRQRMLRVEEVLSLTPGTRLAVVGFGGERILIALGKNGVTPLAQRAGCAAVIAEQAEGSC